MKLYLFIVIVLLQWIVFVASQDEEIPYVDDNEEDAHSNYAVHRRINHKSNNSKDDLLYFFSLHDYNGDNELDGNELFASYIDGFDPSVEEKQDMQFIIEWVDHTLEEDDIDGNGKISWTEYLASQKYHDSK